MKSISSPGPDMIKVVRWIARIMSLLFILMVLFFFMGEVVCRNLPRTTPLPIIPLVLGALLFIGLGLAWKWEFPGASISLVCFIALSIMNPNVLTKPLWYFLAIIAILFLLCWWWSKHPDKQKEM